jgi:AraC family transcriptional regulator
MHLQAVAPNALDNGPAPARYAEPNRRPASPAVLQAVATIHERYAEQLTLERLASEVYASPLDFGRMFAGETGLTPSQFLTAMRLFEAKRLLLTTPLSIAEIVRAVGYAGVDSFTSHFSKLVGMSPSQYRDPAVGEMLVAVAPRLSRMPSVQDLSRPGSACGSGAGSGSVTARVSLPRTVSTAKVLVGLFAEPVPQSGPIVFAGLPEVRSGDRVTLPEVPPGRWYLIAVAEHGDIDHSGSEQDAPAQLSVGIRFAPITMSPHGHAIVLAGLRTPRPTDAPVAFTLAHPTSTARHDVARPAELAA